MIAFALSLPSTSHTICIGNSFHHVNPYIEITTVISDSSTSNTRSSRNHLKKNNLGSYMDYEKGCFASSAVESDKMKHKILGNFCYEGLYYTILHKQDSWNCLLYGEARCPLFRGFLCIAVCQDHRKCPLYCGCSLFRGIR